MASKSAADWHSVWVHRVGSSEGCGEGCARASQLLRFCCLWWSVLTAFTVTSETQPCLCLWRVFKRGGKASPEWEQLPSVVGGPGLSRKGNMSSELRVPLSPDCGCTVTAIWPSCHCVLSAMMDCTQTLSWNISTSFFLSQVCFGGEFLYFWLNFFNFSPLCGSNSDCQTSLAST